MCVVQLVAQVGDDPLADPVVQVVRRRSRRTPRSSDSPSADHDRRSAASSGSCCVKTWSKVNLTRNGMLLSIALKASMQDDGEHAVRPDVRPQVAQHAPVGASSASPPRIISTAIAAARSAAPPRPSALAHLAQPRAHRARRAGSSRMPRAAARDARAGDVALKQLRHHLAPGHDVRHADVRHAAHQQAAEREGQRRERGRRSPSATRAARTRASPCPRRRARGRRPR